MDSPAAVLTVLSMVAYCAVAVLLWRVATQPFVGVRGRLALRVTAGLLLFVLMVFLWTAADSYAP